MLYNFAAEEALSQPDICTSDEANPGNRSSLSMLIEGCQFRPGCERLVDPGRR